MQIVYYNGDIIYTGEDFITTMAFVALQMGKVDKGCFIVQQAESGKIIYRKVLGAYKATSFDKNRD